MLNNNEPLLLRLFGKNYLWDGSRLNDEFEKNIDLTHWQRHESAPLTLMALAMLWEAHLMERNWKRC